MTGETSSPVIVITTIYSWMGWGIPRTPDDVTEHSQLTMQRFLEVLSSPDKQLVTSVMSGSQHTVHLLINNICIYAASNLTKFKLIDIYYNQIIQHNMGYTCRVFITVNYMQPNLRATEVPGCSRVTCLLLAVIGISTQDLVLEFAVIVNGYSPRL